MDERFEDDGMALVVVGQPAARGDPGPGGCTTQRCSWTVKPAGRGLRTIFRAVRRVPQVQPISRPVKP